MNSRLHPLCDKIKSRHFWHHMYPSNNDFAIDFWGRMDVPPGK
jgi:hypothetical protein